MTVETIVTGLVGLVGTLLAASAKREIGLAAKADEGHHRDLGALQARVTALEIALAAASATSAQRDRRLDEVITEIGEVRSMLTEVLSRLPKRSSDAPFGGHS